MFVGTALGNGLVCLAGATFLGTTSGMAAGSQVSIADLEESGDASRFLDRVAWLRSPNLGPQVVGVDGSGVWSMAPFLQGPDFRESALAASRGLTALVAGSHSNGSVRWLMEGGWVVRPLIENSPSGHVVNGFSAVRDEGLLVSHVAHRFTPWGEILSVGRSLSDRGRPVMGVHQRIKSTPGHTTNILKVSGNPGGRAHFKERIMGQPETFRFSPSVLGAYRSALGFVGGP